MEFLITLAEEKERMFHPYKKESSYLRAAIYKCYKGKCIYCGQNLQQRAMHIDHIIPSNMRTDRNKEVTQYIAELENNGFIVDCIENYLPACPACNIGKSNQTFSASNLRYYHELAKRHVDEILHRIDQLKLQSKEFFYEPIDPNSWEILDFSYQRNISHAIMGYRLTPADVVACPRFPQVERMTEQLSIVDYVILQGQTGCGKSISVYQTAYDFYNLGWNVYRYKSTGNDIVPIIPQNTEPSLYIIDDAQLLSNKTLETLSEQARPNTKIIFAKTVAQAVQSDTILLTNNEAVDILYKNFLKRKDEILPIVHQCDKNIGINFFDTQIEWRLENAKKAATPWQFNYTLRGGWQTIKEQYQAIAAHHNCGMLAAIISAFQIMLLDNAVDYGWLCTWIQGVDDSLLWNKDDLLYLIDRKIILSEDDVRIVHLEGAKAIFAHYLESSNLNNGKLQAIIEQAFLENRVTPLGLVWLCNGIRRYTWNDFDQCLINEKIIVHALEDIQHVDSAEIRMEIAYFMEKVFTMDYEKNGHWYFCKNKHTILNWIEHATTENAYAYSQLINTVYNTNHEEHKDFVDDINWTKLLSSLDNEREPNLYAWGELVNRLTAFFPRGKEITFAKKLHSTIDKLVAKVNIANIGGLSEFFSSISHLSSGYVHNAINSIAPLYKTFFQNDMLHATEIFDLDFLTYICGMNFFGRNHPTTEQQQTARILVEVIPEREFANMMSTGYPRYWRRIYDIMWLINKYSEGKAKKIVSLVDIEKLTEKAKDTWSQPDDIIYLCSTLAIGDSRIARHFIEYNSHRLQEIYSPLIMIAPKCTVELFKRGISVDLMTNHWWEYSYRAFQSLIRIDTLATKKILYKNLSRIAEYLNSISAYDIESGYCLKFVQKVHDFDLSIFLKLVEEIDMAKMRENWVKSYEGSFKKKQIKKRFEKLLELLTKQVIE